MQLETRKYLNRNTAILSFLSERAAFLATWPQVGVLQAQLQAQNATIEQLAATQAGSSDTASQKVALKKTLVDALKQDLRDIARTAKSMERLDPGIQKEFQMPSSLAEQSVVSAARVFADKAAPAAIKDKFLSYGMPADFLDDLNADIALYEEMLTGKNAASQNAEQSLSELESAITQSGVLADALDAMMKNIYRADPDTLTVWSRAKRIEQLRAHRATA